jgi:stage V sporulation protein AC
MPKGVFLMNMSKKEYNAYVQRLAPKSPIWKDLLNAFWTGGLICVLGQLIQNGWAAAGLDKDAAGSATAISLIFLSAVLTALSVYNCIAKFAGAGTLVPITGFANSVVSPAMEYRSEGLVTGMAAKMFTIAGPVIVYGTVASVLYGVIYWLCTAL